MEVKIIPGKGKRIKQGIDIQKKNQDHDSDNRSSQRALVYNKLKVAAYCRVSTDLEDQESSYESQVEHYYTYICGHEDWEYAGIYADEGISGTTTLKREGFNQMLQDCKSGDIDMILTKSISRFARNTLDCLRYIRMLKEMHIAVYFEKESINTLEAQGEVLITIMASIAQQESKSISENVRMGIHYQFEQGKVRINHANFLGYTKDEEGQLIIVAEEAEIVRRIFMEFLCGISMSGIARGLTADRVPTPTGGSKWYTSTIKSILTNEKYMGDAILQKYYTKDFLTKKQVVNDGVYPSYYIENDHEPIISRDVYHQVQKILQQRAEKRDVSRNRYNYYYALSGKIVCGKCGSPYYRFHMNGKNIHSTWRCKKRISKDHSCDGPIMKESELHAAILQAFQPFIVSRTFIANRIHKLNSQILPELDEERLKILETLDMLQHQKDSKTDSNYEEKTKSSNKSREYIELKRTYYYRIREEQEEYERKTRMEHENEKKSSIEKAWNLASEELNQLTRIMSYIDFYEHKLSKLFNTEDNKKDDTGRDISSCIIDERLYDDELYDEDLMRLILEEVKVYDNHLSIRFCSGEEKVVHISMN